MSREEPVLVANGLSKRFGRFRGVAALDGLDLEIARDRVTVLLGRNGAGKSTLLRLANGMLKPDRGSLRVLGRDPIRETDAVRTRTGFVPDAPDVPPWMTPREWLRFLEPHYPRFDVRAANELYDRFAVPQRTRFKDLSKGQAMLALLGAATAHEPELLLLDEPFGALDPVARDEVLKALIGELRYGGTSVILSTHDLEIACRVADDIVVIDAGRVTWHGALDIAQAATPDEPIVHRLKRTLAGVASVAATTEQLL